MAFKKPANSQNLKKDKRSRKSQRSDPPSYSQEKIVWAFSRVDEEGDWGWRTQASSAWWDYILPKLQNFESMTWIEIMQAVGGRSRGNNSHPVLVEKLTANAKKRLGEIDQNDVTELFSLRLDSTTRIYGIRDQQVLKLLWYDKHHGNNAMAVYPVQR